MPFGLAGDAARVGVEEELVGVEAVSFVRAVGAVGAVAVELAGAEARDMAVPDVAFAFGEVRLRTLPGTTPGSAATPSVSRATLASRAAS